ncbi:transporter substrate-binding domain-containing protein [Vreelandella sedimenti]|nr:transporter substrate-binding domain-containing protein [Halomonas sedimenti]
MSRKLFTLCTATALTTTLASFAMANEQLADELNTEGTITVCISKNAYPPMYWKENGQLTGFDVVSMEAIAEQLGLGLQFMEVAFDGLMPGIVSGRCDMMRSGLYVSEARTNVADAIPYLRTGPALLVMSGNPAGITSTDDLSGKTVAAQSASANAEILGELSESFETAGQDSISIALYPELPETVAAVQNHRADAVIETDVAAASVADSLSGRMEVIGGLFDSDTMFGMYFPQGSLLKDAIETVVIELTEDGTLEEIAVQFGLMPENIASVEEIQG